MEPLCRHEYEETAVVFTGTVCSRTCRRCELIEVMVEKTGLWMAIDAYLERRLADRASPPDLGGPKRP